MGHEDDDTPDCRIAEITGITCTVYGASDDLIEIEGGIEEEFNPKDGETSYLAFSNGTVVSIRYDDEGNWRIVPEHHGPGAVAIAQVVAGGEAYSDIATVRGDIKWVVFGTQMVRANG